MSRAAILAMAEAIRKADSWTWDVLDMLRLLSIEAGIDPEKYSEPFWLAIDVQNALGVDLGE